jgi:hypothetical protein
VTKRYGCSTTTRVVFHSAGCSSGYIFFTSIYKLALQCVVHLPAGQKGMVGTSTEYSSSLGCKTQLTYQIPKFCQPQKSTFRTPELASRILRHPLDLPSPTLTPSLDMLECILHVCMTGSLHWRTLKLWVWESGSKNSCVPYRCSQMHASKSWTHARLQKVLNNSIHKVQNARANIS